MYYGDPTSMMNAGARVPDSTSQGIPGLDGYMAGVMGNLGMASAGQMLQSQQTQNDAEALALQQKQKEESAFGELSRNLKAAQTKTTLGTFTSGLQDQLAHDTLISELSGQHSKQLASEMSQHLMRGEIAVQADSLVNPTDQQGNPLPGGLDPVKRDYVKKAFKSVGIEDLPDDDNQLRAQIHTAAQAHLHSKDFMMNTIKFLQESALQGQKDTAAQRRTETQVEGEKYRADQMSHAMRGPQVVTGEIADALSRSGGNYSSLNRAEAGMLLSDRMKNLAPEAQKDIGDMLQKLEDQHITDPKAKEAAADEILSRHIPDYKILKKQMNESTSPGVLGGSKGSTTPTPQPKSSAVEDPAMKGILMSQGKPYDPEHFNYRRNPLNPSEIQASPK